MADFAFWFGFHWNIWEPYFSNCPLEERAEKVLHKRVSHVPGRQRPHSVVYCCVKVDSIRRYWTTYGGLVVVCM